MALFFPETHAITEPTNRWRCESAWLAFFRGLRDLINGISGAIGTTQFITAAPSADLNNERVLTNTATVTWDFGSAGQAKANVVPGGIDITTLGGFPGGTTLFLRGDGTFTVPPGGGGTVTPEAVRDAGRWEPLANGITATPEIVFNLGDVIMVWNS